MRPDFAGRQGRVQKGRRHRRDRRPNRFARKPICDSRSAPSTPARRCTLSPSAATNGSSRTIELVGELEPFRHAFLGILPLREEAEPEPAGREDKADEATGQVASDGVVVRMVYPGSPAAAAGNQAGDRIVKIDDAEIDNIKAAIGAMNNVVPASEVAVRLVRDGKPLEL